jgi:hypothetical protein
MEERRGDGRLPSYLGGKIVYNNRLSTADCLVRNISAEGFRLSFGSTIAVPDEFELQIPQKGVRCQVRVSWRKLDEIGAVVIPADEQSVDRARLRKLERENAELKRRRNELENLDPPR